MVGYPTNPWFERIHTPARLYTYLAKRSATQVLLTLGMAPTSLHVLVPRDGPSVGELFHQFPARVWLITKLIIFGLCIMLALCAIIFGVCFAFASLVFCVRITIESLKSGKARTIVEDWREKVGRLGRIERLDRTWKWLKRMSARGEAEVVDAEELEHLDSLDAEGRESSVGGETLFGSEEDEDGDRQANKKEKMDLDSEDYMEGKP